MTTVSFPHQGTIYLSRALRQGGDTKKRLVIVVSIDVRNQYSATLLVVPFSSDVEASAGNPCRIFISAGEGGLERDSIAMCDLITTVEKRYLERGPYGSVSPKLLQQIQQGIQIAIGLYPT
ncbi:MAG: type II toxin-antitoxin system PemK/MazF family toxin [Coleofasciculus sp. Co-bin14]|nr:type II toxin-antitoxin system PemK/MazF family toxin [Coleofasciculus sp. Co-bin14]